MYMLVAAIASAYFFHCFGAFLRVVEGMRGYGQKDTGRCSKMLTLTYLLTILNLIFTICVYIPLLVMCTLHLPCIATRCALYLARR